MTPQPASSSPRPPAAQLIPMLDGLVLHQLLYAAASLGLADILDKGPLSTNQIARPVSRISAPPLKLTDCWRVPASI